MQSVKPWLAEAVRRPGARLIWASTLGLAVLAAATFYVSFRAQFTFMYAVKHQDLPALIEALIADVAMVVCSLLALGMACAGQSAKVARLLVIVFAGLSAGMNYLAADVSSFRSVAVYVMPPVVFAVCTDQVVAVIRRHGLGITEDSAWTVLGRLALAVMRLVGIILLYGLRFILAPAETGKGLRRMVLNAAPLPGTGQNHRWPEGIPGASQVSTSGEHLVSASGERPESTGDHEPLPLTMPSSRRSPASRQRPRRPVAGEDAEQEFMSELAEGTVPSLRQIRARMHVNQDNARRLRAHLEAVSGPVGAVQ